MAKDTVAADAAGPYPYPGLVSAQAGEPVHYGRWPDRMELGTMGVCYWEKLELGGASSYHFSAYSLMDDEAVKSSTLSNAHGDVGIVTEYGYGYFHQADTPRPLWSVKGSTGTSSNFIPRLRGTSSPPTSRPMRPSPR